MPTLNNIACIGLSNHWAQYVLWINKQNSISHHKNIKQFYGGLLNEIEINELVSYCDANNIETNIVYNK